MDERLKAWLDHADTYKRSAIVGVSLGGPENVLVYQHINEMSDDDFEDVMAMLFVLFSGRPDAPLERRLMLMDAAWRHARQAVVLEGAPAAGEA
jgi:diphthamide biosynthesis methyltransferase